MFGNKRAVLDDFSYFNSKSNSQWVFDKQLFRIAVWAQKAFFEKAILPNLFGRAFCGIDIIAQKFEIITPNIIKK